jgi:uncharacterized membrane protein
MVVPFPPFSWRQLHPILVHFTAALVPVSFAADLAAKAAHRRSLADAAWWMLLVAALVTPLTAATGWWLRLKVGQSQSDLDPIMTAHQWLGTGLVLLFVGLCAWRGMLQHKNVSPGWRYLLCGCIVVLLTAYQGHLGGNL